MEGPPRSITALVESTLLHTKHKCVVKVNTLADFKLQLQTQLGLGNDRKLMFEIFDADFEEYCALDNWGHLANLEKAKIKISSLVKPLVRTHNIIY